MSEHSNRNRQRSRPPFPLLLVLGVMAAGILMSSCANTDSSSPGIPVPPSLPGGGAAGLPSPGSPTGSTADGNPGGKADGDSSGQTSETTNNDSGDGSKEPGSDTSGEDSGQAGEPGFETADSQDAQLPDLRDTTEERSAKRGDFGGIGEAAEGESSATDQGAGTTDTAGNQSGDSAATGDRAGAADGPRTSAEQVAILDAELERGTGNFDDLILAEQEEQRRRERDRAQPSSAPQQPTKEPSNSGRAGAYEGGMAGGSGGGAPPTNPVKYKPPPDIPSGDNDDVVARQLREAAMREPDPAVRERLWDEYRKYKGSN